jgi:hypothetical protein
VTPTSENEVLVTMFSAVLLSGNGEAEDPSNRTTAMLIASRFAKNVSVFVTTRLGFSVSMTVYNVSVAGAPGNTTTTVQFFVANASSPLAAAAEAVSFLKNNVSANVSRELGIFSLQNAPMIIFLHPTEAPAAPQSAPTADSTVLLAVMIPILTLFFLAAVVTAVFRHRAMSPRNKVTFAKYVSLLEQPFPPPMQGREDDEQPMHLI